MYNDRVIGPAQKTCPFLLKQGDDNDNFDGFNRHGGYSYVIMVHGPCGVLIGCFSFSVTKPSRMRHQRGGITGHDFRRGCTALVWQLRFKVLSITVPNTRIRESFKHSPRIIGNHPEELQKPIQSHPKLFLRTQKKQFWNAKIIKHPMIG